MDVELIRKYCLAQPAVTEDIKWDHDLCFSVGGKMFCVTALDPPFGCSFKVKDEEFEEMSNRDGMMPAPYMARARWIKISDPLKLNKKEWEFYLLQSYELVKSRLTKKLRSELGLT